MTPPRTRWILLVTVIVLILIFLSSVFLSGIFLSLGFVPPVIHTPYGFVIMNAAIPDTPREMPMYRGILRDGDYLDENFEKQYSDQPEMLTESQAVVIAGDILQQYGGIPADAKPPSAKTQYLYTYNGSSGKVIDSTPQGTTVFYSRHINGLPVVGLSDRIIVELGQKGELVWIFKRWRTLESSGVNATVISPQKALIKMSQGEIADPPMCCLNVFIVKNVTPGYFEKYPANPAVSDSSSSGDPEIDLEPVWILKGTFPDGDAWSMSIPARQNSTLRTHR